MRICRTMLVTATKQAGVSLPPIPPKVSIPYKSGTDSHHRFAAVRGASVRGRVTSVPLKKANWLADRLHSIGRFEGGANQNRFSGHVGDSSAVPGGGADPDRGNGWASARRNREGVPTALIRRVLTKERGFR